MATNPIYATRKKKGGFTRDPLSVPLILFPAVFGGEFIAPLVGIEHGGFGQALSALAVGYVMVQLLKLVDLSWGDEPPAPYHVKLASISIRFRNQLPNSLAKVLYGLSGISNAKRIEPPVEERKYIP